MVRLDELMLPADQLARMGALSDDAALRVALKPWAVRMLIERGADVACFLDLDAEICGSFDEVERLSEEHGVCEVPEGETGFDVGDRVEIIPNHVCPTVNLMDELTIVRDGKVVDSWPIAARGKVQ